MSSIYFLGKKNWIEISSNLLMLVTTHQITYSKYDICCRIHLLDNIMHFLPHTAVRLCPRQNRIEQTEQHRPVDPDKLRCSSKGSRRPISVMRTHNPLIARSEYHTQLANRSFDKLFDLTAGVYSYFHNIFCGVLAYIPMHTAVSGSRNSSGRPHPFPVL